MASAPIAPEAVSDEVLVAEQLTDFVLIRTDQVAEGERLRPVDMVWARALGEMMARDGQDTAIQVCRLPGQQMWTLVAGCHRFNGAKAKGIAYLKAEIVSADRDDRRLREVRENLWRSDLDPIDRAANIAEAVAIYKRRAGIDPTKDGRSASSKARWQKQIEAEADDATDTMAVVYGWGDEVGEQIGLSARTVRRDLMLYRRLAPSLVERLRKARHPAMANATHLRALAKLDEPAQRKVVELLLVPGASLNYGQPTSIPEAIAHPLGPVPARAKPDPETKRLSAFIGTFQRMTLAEKKGAIAQLQGMFGSLLAEGALPSKANYTAQHEQYREDALASIDAARDVIEGIVEDDILPGDRGADLRKVSGGLQLTRLTIAGYGFELGRAA